MKIALFAAVVSLTMGEPLEVVHHATHMTRIQTPKLSCPIAVNFELEPLIVNFPLTEVTFIPELLDAYIDCYLPDICENLAKTSHDIFLHNPKIALPELIEIESKKIMEKMVVKNDLILQERDFYKRHKHPRHLKLRVFHNGTADKIITQ